MRLLFDQNLSPRLVQRLRHLYPGSAHLQDLGLDRAKDREMWAYTRDEGFVVVSKDADFQALCETLGVPPYVIWIRRGNCSTAEVEALLRGTGRGVTHPGPTGGAAILELH